MLPRGPFGISESFLSNLLQAAAVDAGIKPGATPAKDTELREAKCRVLLLEQENEVLRRAEANLFHANQPAKCHTHSSMSGTLSGVTSGRVVAVLEVLVHSVALIAMRTVPA